MYAPPEGSTENVAAFLRDGTWAQRVMITTFWHPDFVADRLLSIWSGEGRGKHEVGSIEPQLHAEIGLPDDIRRSIQGRVSSEDRASLKRPRVVLHTSLTRTSPGYEQTRQTLRSVRPGHTD